MYSHYFNGVFNPLTASLHSEQRTTDQGSSGLDDSVTNGFAKILRAIESQFSIGTLDTGDILLSLIVLLLLLEGDNLELVITLGLMLLLS